MNTWPDTRKLCFYGKNRKKFSGFRFHVSGFISHIPVIRLPEEVISMKVERFEDLEIWKEARELSLLVKKVTKIESASKDFSFREQFRISVGSIIDNIAEGFERDGKNEFIQFLSIAKGSCRETRSQCYRAYDYGYIQKEELDEMVTRSFKLSKKISSLINYLKSSDLTGIKFK
jgi:four helix bundle protein